MVDKRYEFLFPYEKIPVGSNILIYGAGGVGISYLRQIHITHFCKVIGFVDKQGKLFRETVVPVYRPDEIGGVNFDYVVVALVDSASIREVIDSLKKQKVKEDKIVFVGRRIYDEFEFCLNKSKKKLGDVAIKLGGGLGDDVIAKGLIEELMKKFPEGKIDIYSSIKLEDIKAIMWGVQVNNYIHDIGGAYLSNIEGYDLAMRLPGTPQIDIFCEEKISEKNKKFAKEISDYIAIDKIPCSDKYMYIQRAIYNKKKFFNASGQYGLFSDDGEVNIDVNPKYMKMFEELHLRKYVTVNYGNGVSGNNDDAVHKQWPYAYICEFIDLFKKEYKDIEVIQIGAKNARRLENVNRCFLGYPIELVKYILRDSIFHLDSEGGLVHLATHLGTVCIVIFGMTDVRYFGYPQNINVYSEKCNGCYGLNLKEVYTCVRGLKKPECLWSITPFQVMSYAKDYIDSTVRIK